MALVGELRGLIPALEYGRATHLDWGQWLEKHPEQLAHEPGLGDMSHHREQVQVYDDRIRLINAAIAVIEAGSGKFT